jgi:DNA-binding PadR family transcriptional regulator
MKLFACATVTCCVSFEIQELPDVIRVIVLLNLSKGKRISKSALKRRLDKVCVGYACVEMSELENALKEMASEGLIVENNSTVKLTPQGKRMGKEWESLLLKKEPIMEIVAGLVDGSITGLVVIISALIAALQPSIAIFAALLTLSAVAITNFSSFLLGGITEDMADIITLQNLMNFSLSDIPDKKERDKSLLLVKKLFVILDREIHRSNVYAAIICGTTTFLAGSIPIATYLALTDFYPLNIILSLSVVAAVVGIFLVRYRSRKTRVSWKITLIETMTIIIVATLASLVLGGVA